MRLVSAIRRRRPPGVYVIIFLLALRVLDLFSKALRVQRAGITTLLLPSDASPTLQTAISIAATVFVVLLIVGLLRLNRWALIITTILTGVSLAFGLWLYVQEQPQYVNMFAATLIAFYLHQREVQDAFNPQAAAQ